MEFKAGDRVHVKKFMGLTTDFYATLTDLKEEDGIARLISCTGGFHERSWVYLPNNKNFGENKREYYTLATDEEDTEEPVIQLTTDTHDPVNKPSHYMLGDIEVKNIIAIVADKYHKGSVAHNVASALEYQMRAPGKNGLEDIKKARKCLDFAIENWE
ncbi:DUF3310 domain-containing protein [Mammaliicoccus sciuri]|uniref:DUF3310 domain-containing protein n=1 Tax=Mammaliicoccus sciuri TaxID=1296 RepID=UPI003F5747DA